MSKSGAEKSPYTADQVKHMQRQYIRPSKHAFQIWLQEIRPGKGPLRRCYGYEKVGKSTKPYLATHPADMVIQHWIVLFVVTSFEHDTHEVSQSVADDLPVARTRLGVPGHYIGSDLHTLGSCVCRKILPRHPCLVQVKGQIALFAEYANTAQNLPSPRFGNRYNPDCVVAGLILVVCIQTR